MKKENQLKLNHYLSNIRDLSESLRNVIKMEDVNDEIYLVYINLLEENMKKVKSILKDFKK